MKILVVDDAPYMIKVLRDILVACGHEVHEAVTGEDALIRYSDIEPQVVLMDVLMPSMDGVGATRKILEMDPQAKIIVITAVGKTGLEKECLEAGARKFISKPFKIKELINMIESVGANEGN
jgi:two-component system chemotaxis response regulator CheY